MANTVIQKCKHRAAVARDVLSHTIQHVHLQMLDKMLRYRKKYWSVLIGETLVDGGVDLSFYVILLQRNKEEEAGQINNTKWGRNHPY